MSNSTPLAQPVIIGDGKLCVVISCDEQGLRESRYEIGRGCLSDLAGIPWVIETNRGVLEPGTGRLIKPVQTDTANQQASFAGHLENLDWQLDYEVTGAGRITKTLTLMPRHDLVLKRVTMWQGHANTDPIIASTALQDIAAFYRQDNKGIFVSLDFPYSKITTENHETRVTYPPHDKLLAGKAYTCHTLTIGATELTEQSRYGFDDGEVEAMDSYIQERFPLRFDRPMFVSASINNRYTQVTNKGVFYTMKDHPTLSFNHDLLKREIALIPKLGMEYYQLWTGPFDSVPDDPDPAFVHEIVAFAKKHGVRVGDYSGANEMFCFHYNEYCNSLENHPEWGIVRADVCFGNPKFVKFYKDMVVNTDKKYGFEIHCLDFLNIRECNATDHDHAPGPASVYAQVRGLVEILEGIDNVSPQMMSWSNSGNWIEFLPKIAWTNHNLYLTDPYIGDPWQGLNMTRLLDDVRRDQMVYLHYSRFMPYRSFTNCQYFFSQNSIVPDTRNYQFGALATIAVTPNLCLAEIRPWLDKLPADKQQEVLRFYKKWTDFLKRNYNLWKKTYQAGENPGMGSVEIYSHAKGSRGYIFLVNSQYWSRTVEVPLDQTLGFSARGKCEITELYPVERLKLMAQGPFADFGTMLPIHVPAQSVVVLQVKPAPKTITQPRLYGVPGSIETTADGYLIKTWGAQGKTERAAVLLPEDSAPISTTQVRDVPKQPKRLWSPTPVQMVAGNHDGIAMDITFRRDAAPDELRHWSVKPGTLAEGETAGWISGIEEGTDLNFPVFTDVSDDGVTMPMWDAKADQLGLGALANFCGAYIDNAFSETQETWIDLKTGAKSDLPEGVLASTEAKPALHPLPVAAKDMNNSWWVQTSFYVPFIHGYGCEPSLDEHAILVLPFVRQNRISQVHAWINGVPLEVRKYHYPRNRSLSCFYADLVGSAAQGDKENKLVIQFETK
jgi:hypothetical protein